MNQKARFQRDNADARLQGEKSVTGSERRWQVIDLLNEGLPLIEVVAATGYQPRTIRRIAQRYRQFGAAGLVDGRQRSAGAVPLLSVALQQELCEVLRHPPVDGEAWTGPKVAQWIASKLGRPVRRQRGWDYLQRLRSDGDAPTSLHAPVADE